MPWLQGIPRPKLPRSEGFIEQRSTDGWIGRETSLKTSQKRGQRGVKSGISLLGSTIRLEENAPRVQSERETFRDMEHQGFHVDFLRHSPRARACRLPEIMGQMAL